jgi:hypothetical protein
MPHAASAGQPQAQSAGAVPGSRRRAGHACQCTIDIQGHPYIMLSMAQMPKNGQPVIRLGTPNLTGSSALAKAARGDNVITSDGRAYRVHRISTVSGKRNIQLTDVQGAVTVIVLDSNRRVSTKDVVAGQRVKAPLARKVANSRSKAKAAKAKKASSRRILPDPSEVSVSVRSISGGLPGLGKRR